MTIHQSKGMEFDTVSLFDFDDHLLNVDDPSEEANVIFVGITRARRLLNRIEQGGQQGGLMPRLVPRQFGDGARTRWEHWRNYTMSLEAGLPGDVDPNGFIDTTLHGSMDAVVALQDWLAKKARILRGRKVMLCKRTCLETKHVIYDIHLQTKDKKPIKLLGMMSKQLTVDILSRIWKLGYGLPNAIFNLHIADVVAVHSSGGERVGLADPWSSSRIWLGVSICGTGDFKTIKRGR